MRERERASEECINVQKHGKDWRPPLLPPPLSLLFPLKAAKRKGFLDHGMAARRSRSNMHSRSLGRSHMRQMEGSFAVVIASARWFARAVWTFDK